MKLNRKEIKDLAIRNLVSETSNPLDAVLMAVTMWLNKNELKIVDLETWAKVEAKRHMTLSKELDGEGTREAQDPSTAEPVVNPSSNKQ